MFCEIGLFKEDVYAEKDESRGRNWGMVLESLTLFESSLREAKKGFRVSLRALTFSRVISGKNPFTNDSTTHE